MIMTYFSQKDNLISENNEKFPQNYDFISQNNNLMSRIKEKLKLMS